MEKTPGFTPQPENEALPSENKIEQIAAKHEKKETSFRLLAGVEVHLRTTLGKMEVIGRENLDAIPADAKVILAVSHISDLDLPAAIKALGHDFDIIVTAQSTNFNFSEDRAGYIATKIAGMDNYLPVDYAKTAEGKRPEFNPDNFTSMAEALNRGKTILIAAHNPTYDGKLGSGSVGPAYLAQIANAIIVPIAVNLKTTEALGIDGTNKAKTMLTKPDFEVHIGKPVKPQTVEGATHVKEIMDKRSRGEKLSPEEREQFHTTIAALRGEADVVLHEIADMLPEAKRGEYTPGQVEQQDNI